MCVSHGPMGHIFRSFLILKKVEIGKKYVWKSGEIAGLSFMIQKAYGGLLTLYAH